MDIQKEYASLMEAYNAVYENQEQLDEGHGSRTSFKKQSADERKRVSMFKGSKIEYTPHKNYDPEANRGQGQILRPNQAEKQRRKKLAKSVMGEGVDLFDYLLEYLVAEGYADTNKAALAIMANMSEEWKQSIVEQNAIVTTGTSTNAAGERIPWTHRVEPSGKRTVEDKFGKRELRGSKLKGV